MNYLYNVTEILTTTIKIFITIFILLLIQYSSYGKHLRTADP
jgi:hypothetical protein